MVNPLWATIQHDQPVIYRFLITINIRDMNELMLQAGNQMREAAPMQHL